MARESSLPVDVDVAIVPPVSNRPPAEAVNFFHVAVSGPEIQLLVGYTDPELVNALAGEASKGGRTFHPEIAHRFMMTPRGFALLKAQIDAVSEAMKTTRDEAVDERK